MSDEHSHHELITRLQCIADDGACARNVRDRAQELATRLKHGVRIVVLGPAGIGKSQLCDAILSCPASVMERGQHRVFETETTGGLKNPLLEGAQHFSLPFSTPHWFFEKTQIVDLAGQASDAENTALAHWAFQNADVVLWCTDSFGETERDLWAMAPDSLKDHSVLVLTKADVLAKQGILHERISSNQLAAANEFHSFFPVATRHLRAVQSASASVSENQLAASGIKALTDAMTSILQSGQRADLDGALLFLERHGSNQNDTGSPQTTTRQRQGAREDNATRGAPNQAFEAMLRRLKERAVDLSHLTNTDVEVDVSQILETCGRVSEELLNEMQAVARCDPKAKPWCLAFEEASDKIMLMTLEDDAQSAADAVTILLQMRRDLDCLSIS
ncbi:MAG: GTPase domain-containing protein [Roseobacter sp.]